MLGEKIVNKPNSLKTVVKTFNKKNVFVCLSVLIIGIACCVNWILFQNNTLPSDTNIPVSNENLTDNNTLENENVASYFASVQISRQQARDEALEVLSMLIDSESTIESVKEEAINDITRIADEIANEANIESLVKAKGFEDCIAVINQGNATIIVKNESVLMQNEVAQIMEIVCEQANISPENIKITQKY